MIITLTKADFSAKNIGTLSSFNILLKLGAGCTYNGSKIIENGNELSATISIAANYTPDLTNCIITMGGVQLRANDDYVINFEDGVVTLEIAKVTGQIVIILPTSLITTPDTPDVPLEPEVPDAPSVDDGTPILLGEILDETWIKMETGEEATLKNWKSTDYILIPDNTTKMSTADITAYRSGGNNTAIFAFYDVNKDFIGAVGTDIANGTSWRNAIEDFPIPENAIYTRICWSIEGYKHKVTGVTTSITEPVVYWGSIPVVETPEPEEPDIPVEPEIPEEPAINGELIDLGSIVSNKWIAEETGAVNNLSNWCSTDFITIPDNAIAMSTEDITAFRNGTSNTAVFAFYDADQVFISSVGRDIVPINTTSCGAKGAWRDGIYDFPIPDNAMYVKICWTKELYTHLTTSIKTSITQPEVYWIVE